MLDLIDLRDEFGPPSWSRGGHCSPKAGGYVELRRNLNDETKLAFDVLDRIQDAARDGVEDGLERIYDEVDTLLQEGRFAVVDELLRAIDLRDFFPVHLLAFLSITSAAREHVKARAELVTRTRTHLMKIEPDRVKELLAGLE